MKLWYLFLINSEVQKSVSQPDATFLDHESWDFAENWITIKSKT